MDRLLDRVYGALIGSAIGDAMGGPVEMQSYEEIAAAHGWVDRLLPYPPERQLGAHGPWAREAGAYTDDSRMSKLFCDAIIGTGRATTSGDLRRMYAEKYNAAHDLERDFLEEYYFKAMYGDAKQIFGGQPTNGAVMAIAPYGAVCPCNPQRAFDQAFEAMFIVEGYSRHSAAMAAAGIAAAMIPGITAREVVERMLTCVREHKQRVEGPLWSGSAWYQVVGRKNEALIDRAIEIAERHGDTRTLQAELLDVVRQQFPADGAESLAIAMCMFLAADGDYRATVEGCVNFGRDCDSSASVAGAIAGALSGANAIPSEWREAVEAVNPAPTFMTLAEGICDVVRSGHEAQERVVCDVRALLGEG